MTYDEAAVPLPEYVWMPLDEFQRALSERLWDAIIDLWQPIRPPMPGVLP